MTRRMLAAIAVAVAVLVAFGIAAWLEERRFWRDYGYRLERARRAKLRSVS